MPTKYYVDEEGNFLGGFSDGNPSIPVGAIEADIPPGHARKKLVNDEWVDDFPTARSIKIEEARSLIAEKEYANFTYDSATFTPRGNDRTYHMGESTQNRYFAIKEDGGSQLVLDVDDVAHTLTSNEIGDICTAIRARTTAIYTTFAAHVTAINALGAVTEIEEYDVTTGW